VSSIGSLFKRPIRRRLEALQRQWQVDIERTSRKLQEPLKSAQVTLRNDLKETRTEARRANLKLQDAIKQLAQTVKLQHKTLTALNRQMAELRGLLHQQADLTVEALRRAGWESDAGASQQRALQRALRVGETHEDVVAGPWTGEVGFELLYWIPFLTWLTTQGMDGRRLIVISRGGAAPWYRHITSRYVDLFDFMSPQDFRARTIGSKKQREMSQELDQEIVARAVEAAGLRDVEVLHPSVMYRLFGGLWRRRAPVDVIEAFTSYQGLTPPAPEPVQGVPHDYVAAKFYFSKAFPDTSANRLFVMDVLRRISRHVPVVLLSAGLQIDEHCDFQTGGGSGLFVVDSHHVLQQNLTLQTRVICGARGFIGTYGGFSYLAPFYGVRSLSFFSDRRGFENHHLELAQRVFAKLRPGAFVALHRRDLEMVEPAVERWGKTSAATVES
jgi:hypothetical protein